MSPIFDDYDFLEWLKSQTAVDGFFTNGLAPVIRDAKMLQVATTLMVLGFLRVGEFTSSTGTSFDKDVHLSLSVDCLSTSRILFVQLKQSNTDQIWQGVTIVRGKSEQFPFCLLSAMLSYFVVRDPQGLFVWRLLGK